MQAEWITWSDERLLELRLCDLPRLGVRLTGTPVEKLLHRVWKELADRGLRFRPHAWLSDEWFSPDGVPGIAVPFYLGHPRLTALQRALAGEAEGAEPEECLRILRHECGHALENAFGLRRLGSRRALFGQSGTPYPRAYAPRPHSRAFVRHLQNGYAQSHPDEDFAETFAVWLDPKSRWRDTYRDWPALRKLEGMDALMRSLAGRTPPVRCRDRVLALRDMPRTLARHYALRRAEMWRRERALDRHLVRLFGRAAGHVTGRGAADGLTASSLLRKMRKELSGRVAREAGVHRYEVDLVFRRLIARSRALGLRLDQRPPCDLAWRLTATTREYLESGDHLFPL